MKLRTFALAAAFVAASLPAAAAPFPARVILTRDPNTTMECQLRWQPGDKRYAASLKGGGETYFVPGDVIRLQVAPPANWKQLVEQAKKSPDAALPGLYKIMDEYKMLQFDAEAGRVIATVQLRKGNAKEAVDTCRKVLSSNPDAAWNSVLAPVYWQALIDSGNTSPLPALLDKGAASSDRAIAAQSCLKRGDLLFSQGQVQSSLVDGYLRVVFLFGDQKNAQAEALYKAAEAFDKFHRPTYAEKMRSQLLSAHKGSPWAAKLSGGK